jgi:hypothetical protein
MRLVQIETDRLSYLVRLTADAHGKPEPRHLSHDLCVEGSDALRLEREASPPAVVACDFELVIDKVDIDLKDSPVECDGRGGQAARRDI